MRPLYDVVLERLGIASGARLLDSGCGSGLFCQLANAKGAVVSGIDAEPALIAIARTRVPRGDFREGDLEDLPYPDACFDVVTGFNSFQYTANPASALREARRVAKSGAAVTVAAWGRPQDCEAAAYLAALGALLPPPPPGTPGPFGFSGPGALEDLARQAGLPHGETVEVDCTWCYPDLDAALGEILSSAPAVRAIRHSGGAKIRDAVTEAIRPFRTASGGYLLENRFRYLITC